MKQQPMLMESPITKRVFVVMSYVDEGNGLFTAREKYDVTEQFNALVSEQQKRIEQLIEQNKSLQSRIETLLRNGANTTVFALDKPPILWR